jgi:hypothetical protein
MSNRFDQQFPRTDLQARAPIGPDRLQLYLQRARQLRADALAEGLRLTARAPAAALGAVAARALPGYGMARRPPGRTYAITTPSRFTRDHG